jgi:hypothetical protein
MRKVILTFGLLAGGIMCCLGVVIMTLCENGTLDFGSSELVGYSSMIIALSMIFFGIKSYRDNHQNGAITFVKSLKVGGLITLVASLIYVVGWEIYYQTNPTIKETFGQKYTDYYIGKMKEDGATPDEIAQKTVEMNRMMQMYENPLIRAGITLTEIAPVGIVVTLISAAILRKRKVLPA